MIIPCYSTPFVDADAAHGAHAAHAACAAAAALMLNDALYSYSNQTSVVGLSRFVLPRH